MKAVRAAFVARGTSFSAFFASHAFGLLLVGNDRFLTRGGRSERAMFEALASRCPMEWELDRPTAEETAALAAEMFPGDPDCRDRIAAFGARYDTLREMAESYALAESFAVGGKVGAHELERALVLERLKNLPLLACSGRLWQFYKDPRRCRNSPPFPAFAMR